MVTEDAKPNPDLDALFTQLAEPFDPSEIKRRVTHTNRDDNRGAVIAFADPRAYTDRLNQLFTPTGWTRTYDVSTLSSVTRIKKGKLIQTGMPDVWASAVPAATPLTSNPSSVSSCLSCCFPKEAVQCLCWKPKGPWG